MFLELYKPDLRESGWWLLTDTAALSSPPGPLLPGACQGPSLVTVFGHIRLLSCFLLSFPPLEEKKSESNHKVSHLLFRNIFLLLFPMISKYFSGIISPHMKCQARCNNFHVLTGSTFLGNSCLVD